MSNDSRNDNFQQGPTIERCPHDRENPYCMINNALIRDASLSPECRWLLIYLLSNKDGWKIRVAQIIEHVQGHMGRDKVYSLLKKACDAGYMQLMSWKEGNLKRTKYLLSETPKFKKSFPHPDSQDAGNTDANNTIDKNNQNKKSLSKERDKEKEGAQPPDPPRPPDKQKPIERALHISTTQDEHEKLVALKGGTLVKRAYEHLSLWKIDTPKSKWKKNDYRSILRWVFKALEEQDLRDKKLKIQEEICSNYQEKKYKPGKKNWNQESENSNETTSEPVLKGLHCIKLESPLLKELKSSSKAGSNPEETS